MRALRPLPGLSMQLATWNLNSLRVRLPHLLDWLSQQPDSIVGLQELKMADSEFPFEALREAGWQAVTNGQKTYNGVALLARRPLEDVQRDIPGLDDPQRRVIAGTVDDLRVVSVYVPNGQSVDSQKYHYKLDWLRRLASYLADEARRYPQLAVVGDFNIAPSPEDTHDPEAWEGHILCSGPEREALRHVMEAAGLSDAFEHVPVPEQRYTWWDYRAAGFRRNLGLRIDHILLSAPLSERVAAWHVDVEPRRRDRPSDHAPVTVTLADTA